MPAARQISGQGERAERGARPAPSRDIQRAAPSHSNGVGKSLPPLPQPGDKFTEDQLRDRFGVPVKGGIRPSLTSSDIVLVRNVHSNYVDVEKGKRITYAGQYYKGKDDQMIWGNLKLAKSRENGNRLLYFVKQDGVLEFNGIVECIASRRSGDLDRPGALAFELEMVDAAAGAAAGRQGDRAARRARMSSTRTSSAPDLDMIMAVEQKIFERRRFAGRSELLADLHMDIDSARLDLILEYLEYSAKIAVENGSIRWSFRGAGPGEGLNTDRAGADALAVATATVTPVHILSMEERRSPDLDNDLPYNAEIEQMIADCEAGRPIGKTYTAEEYRKHLEQEYGIGAVEYPVEQPCRR